MTESSTTLVLPVVRVAVLADGRITDVALPAEVPLREILPAVERLAHRPDGGEGEAAGDGVPRRLSLAPIGGAPFSLDASLDTVGVVDGDLLALQSISRGPSAPGVVEDVADAAVIFSDARKHPWGPSHIRRAAVASVVAAVLGATALTAVERWSTGSTVPGYVLGVLAVLSIVAALALRTRAHAAAAALAVTALAPVSVGLAAAIPGQFGWPSVLLSAAGVTVWALVAVSLGVAPVAPITAVAVIGSGVLVAAVAAALWHLPWLTLGAGLILLAVAVTVRAAALSALWARLPLPVIPGPGDPPPSAPGARVLESLPQRVRTSAAHQNGFIAGAVGLTVLGSLAVVGLGAPGAVGPWAWYLVVATSLATVLRARIWDNVAGKAWLLSQPTLLLVVLLIAFLGQGHQAAALWTVAVLAVPAVVWVVVAAYPALADADSYSLPVRRLVGLLSAGLDVSLAPVAIYLAGVFTWVLSR